MNVGSLFSGIGGLDLGLERAGMHVAWQCESDPYARAVLRKHWPEVPCYYDVRRFRARDALRVDLICGGFPCQDISEAGRKAGLAGERSGLWFHFARIIGEARPTWAIIENVGAWKRYLPVVRRHLHAAGYASVPLELPAAAFGAPHRRTRIFTVAHAERSRLARLVEGARLPGCAPTAQPEHFNAGAFAWGPLDLDSFLVRARDGVSRRVDRIKGPGNAVVPQVAEYIGRLILAHAEGA